MLRFVAGGSVLAGVGNLAYRYVDSVKGTDEFAKHTNSQHKEHFIWGMHKPFLASAEQLEPFKTHFSQYAHLVPRSVDEFLSRRAIKAGVNIRPLSECPTDKVVPSLKKGTVVVGGGPALLSSAMDRDIVYINDFRQIPIADGAAFHLEYDSPSEAPTGFQPHVFLMQQVKRLVVPETLAECEATGHFSWRSLDWISWIRHPEQWLSGLRLTVHFQETTMMSPEQRQLVLDHCAARAKLSDKFFDELNGLMGGKLLIPGNTGSLIVARNASEIEDMKVLEALCRREHRVLQLLTPDEVRQQYGFVPPNGVMFGDKLHDRTLDPRFMRMIAGFLQSRGGTVIDGVVTTVYTDNPEEGGYVAVRTTDAATGEVSNIVVPFANLVMSLGPQAIHDESGSPFIDLVNARGISAMGLLYMPEGINVPPTTVCGATNHITRLAGPVVATKPGDSSGKKYNVFLMKLTCAACITPNLIDETSAYYDSAAGTALMAAARQTFDADIDVLTVWGCNRQVSRHGELHWFTLGAPGGKGEQKRAVVDNGPCRRPGSTGVHFQLGAGGGGLTQGPSIPPIGKGK